MSGWKVWVDAMIERLQSETYEKYMNVLAAYIEAGGEIDLAFKDGTFDAYLDDKPVHVTMPVYGNVDIDLQVLKAKRVAAAAQQDWKRVAEIDNDMNAREMYKVMVNRLGLKEIKADILQNRLMRMQKSQSQQKWRSYIEDLKTMPTDYTKWPITYYIEHEPRFEVKKSKSTKSKSKKKSKAESEPEPDCAFGTVLNPKTGRCISEKTKTKPPKKLPASGLLASLPFKTKKECSSAERNKPYYMSKTDLMKIIRANPGLKAKMPPNFAKLEKADLCEAVMKQ